MRKSRAVVIVIWAFAAVLLGWLYVRSLKEMTLLGPLGRQVMPANSGKPELLYLGDSVCICTPQVLQDKAAGTLGEMLKRGLQQSVPAFASGQTLFVEDCEAGRRGYGYDTRVLVHLRKGQWIRLAVISVNPRALNLRGSTGFNDPSPMHLPVELPQHELGSDWAVQPWALTAKGAFRGLGRDLYALLVKPFEPQPSRTEPALAVTEAGNQALKLQTSSKSVAQDLYEVYGHGYGLDPEVLQGLLAAGARVQQAKGRVLYYVTPFDRPLIRQQLGAERLAEVDRGVAEAVRRIRAAGYSVLDLSRDADTGFYEPPSEHLEAPQRQRLADKLVLEIGKALR